jgi:drug/metabolite transporter (DMT)-like permease
VSFVAQLIGSNHVGVFTFNGVRFILGALSLIPVILLFEQKNRTKAKLKHTFVIGFVAGLILFGASTLQQIGVEMTGSAGKSGFITGLYTVLVPLFAIFMGKKTNLNTWLGAIFAVSGLYLLSFSGGITSVGMGDVVLLIGAVLWAFHILVIDRYGNSVYSLVFAMSQFIVCGVLSIICAFIFEDVSFAAIYNAKFPILYAGLMSVGVAYTCQILGQKDADPTFATIILSTETVFSALGEAVIFGFVLTSYDYTPITLRGYIGCGIMFLGIIISQLKPFNKKI